jgi:hypothetical protein
MKNLVKRKSDVGYRGHISKGGRANAPSPQGGSSNNTFGGHAPGGPVLASPSSLHRGASPSAGQSQSTSGGRSSPPVGQSPASQWRMSVSQSPPTIGGMSGSGPIAPLSSSSSSLSSGATSTSVSSSMSRGLKATSLDTINQQRLHYPQPNHPSSTASSMSSSISRYASASAVRPNSGRNTSGHTSHSGGGGGGGGHSSMNGGGKVAWPPCSTLFLSRLTGITDDDLALMLQQSCIGLRQHKFTQDKRGERVAFVDFDSVDQAGHAMAVLQGHRGMQCSYARNPLNQRTRSSGVASMQGQTA